MSEAPASETIVRLESIGIRYPKQRTSLLGQLRHSIGRFSPEDRWVLRNVNLSLRNGEVLGVVGANGSGKSTLVRVIAGILSPDEGQVIGSLRSRLLAIGVGFRNELSGRENLRLNATYFGMSSGEIRRHEDSIIDFAGVKQAIDQPVRTYSTGMKARLAFSVATATPPECLVVDEALATGDASFRRRAEDRIGELINNAAAVVIVSHQMGVLKRLCTRCIWIEDGAIREDGDTDYVVASYLREAR